MKLGVIRVPSGIELSDGGVATELARMIEAEGCESIWTVEHVTIPEEYSSVYPFSPTGKMGLLIDDDVPDPITWLSYVAAATSTVKLATGVLILPLRNPVVLAKELATLDRLSGGRLILGVGLGWLEEEFEAIGVPFENRGRRTDEYLDAMAELWRPGRSSISGDFVGFDGIHSVPRPSNGAIPIVIGGASRIAVRRAVLRGNGLHLNRLDVAGVARVRELVDEECAAIGRDAGEIELTCVAPDSSDDAKRLADLGVGRLILSAWEGGLESLRRRIGSYQETVIGSLH
ncbi:MAG: putative oxidoreductase [Microbacteriaceae bacterium]|jgi:probable F420-dependent oxidoreductase|nr:putative oxidoreductase [Microbacteriaceae bacterium]